MGHKNELFLWGIFKEHFNQANYKDFFNWKGLVYTIKLVTEGTESFAKNKSINDSKTSKATRKTNKTSKSLEVH